jgi:hypothetical protein
MFPANGNVDLSIGCNLPTKAARWRKPDLCFGLFGETKLFQHLGL